MGQIKMQRIQKTQYDSESSIKILKKIKKAERNQTKNNNKILKLIRNNNY